MLSVNNATIAINIRDDPSNNGEGPTINKEINQSIIIQPKEYLLKKALIVDLEDLAFSVAHGIMKLLKMMHDFI
jgi:hypothetical protein